MNKKKPHKDTSAKFNAQNDGSKNFIPLGEDVHRALKAVLIDIPGKTIKEKFNISNLAAITVIASTGKARECDLTKITAGLSSLGYLSLEK